MQLFCCYCVGCMVGLKEKALSTIYLYGLDGRGLESGQGQVIFSSPKPVRPAVGPTQPPIQWTGLALLGLRRPVRKVYHSPLSGPQVNNEWNCAFVPPICLHGKTCIINHLNPGGYYMCHQF
jgi:hypothetical protein